MNSKEEIDYLVENKCLPDNDGEIDVSDFNDLSYEDLKLDELKELQVDGCEHRNEYPYAVDYPLSYSEPIIKNTQGEFICDRHSILEYNDYEMKFYEDYEIS